MSRKGTLSGNRSHKQHENEETHVDSVFSEMEGAAGMAVQASIAWECEQQEEV